MQRGHIACDSLTRTRTHTLQALLGFEHRVPHLDGHLVVLKGAGVTPHGAFTSACLQLSPAIALMVVVCSKHNNVATQVQNNGIAGKACQSRITHGSVHTFDSPTSRHSRRCCCMTVFDWSVVTVATWW